MARIISGCGHLGSSLGELSLSPVSLPGNSLPSDEGGSVGLHGYLDREGPLAAGRPGLWNRTPRQVSASLSARQT